MKDINIPASRFSTNSRVVFFTGAGISAESGISTFRDIDGYWSKYDPTKLASPQGFDEDPDLVLQWYAARRKKIKKARPNKAHLAISDFQKLFTDSMVITQNVDGLHWQAGNAPVLELHGNIHREKCFTCGRPGSEVASTKGAKSYCTCGGLMRPNVVWFGESLAMSTLSDAFEATRQCDIFFTIGTSALIYPAAQLPYEARNTGAFVIEVNPEETPFSEAADLSVRGKAGEILPKIFREFNAAIS
ncbi:MAG: NAD-dependent deacylase [Candidatus Marinimicrobia bacterium]|nr:NAD-dependent deacylase [Candidatus Neomarinimicrobiota bacterium]MCF7850086.1 NAD-dependent deacylase [Candidatus Neomarinimicrobiota bacterium]MCF7904853.1 NAD-dependent deacylase [Candidatus Neomarinimicrobiota bacterium]